MHRKAVFALAGIFLAIAFIVPLTILLLQANTDLQNITVIQNPTGLQTSGNITIPTNQEIQTTHTSNLIISAVVAVVFISLFVVTLFYGINHTHPEHQPLHVRNKK